MSSLGWYVAIGAWVGVGVAVFLTVMYIDRRAHPGRRFVNRDEWLIFFAFAAVCAILGPFVAIVAVVDRYGTGHMR